MRPNQRKPGPKSKTRLIPPKKLPQANLGETDTDTSENASFHSPPPDENVTNYNLEFRNTSPQPVTRQSPRRRSTISAIADMPSTSRNVTADSGQVSNRRRKQKFPARRELKMVLRRTDLMIPRLSFGRVIREIMMRQSSEVRMITIDALEALQTAAEKYLEMRFEDSYMVTLHARRKTLLVRDMELVNYLLSRLNVN
ncbi:histone H3-like centromeric protein A [Eurosta solidaginis]|uniref:histone H3-like centromeric protein A n=1 Tax=Eurosta solidaginis TaxID=178769 RepID=UPI0035316BB8